MKAYKADIWLLYKQSSWLVSHCAKTTWLFVVCRVWVDCVTDLCNYTLIISMCMFLCHCICYVICVVKHCQRDMSKRVGSIDSKWQLGNRNKLPHNSTQSNRGHAHNYCFTLFKQIWSLQTRGIRLQQQAVIFKNEKHISALCICLFLSLPSTAIQLLKLKKMHTIPPPD